MEQDILMDKIEKLAVPTDTSCSQLQNFCTLARTAHGDELLDIVRQVLEAAGIYVFAELLALPNVQALKDGPYAKYYNTLLLFAYGTYKQYRQQSIEYLELSPAMQTKLQHLTLASVAIKTKSIPYSVLLEELEVSNVRQLEDIIIEAIYADILHGKLYQNRRLLEVDYAKGRDVPPGHLTKIAETLEEWVTSCDTISNCIAEQIHHANVEKAKRLKNKENIEEQIKYLRRILKQADADDVMQVDALDHTASTSHEVRKKTHKIKIPRSSGGALKFSK